MALRSDNRVRSWSLDGLFRAAMAIAFDVHRSLPENAQKDIEAFAENAGKLVTILERFTTAHSPALNRAARPQTMPGQKDA
jgi:hypothetical protein